MVLLLFLLRGFSLRFFQVVFFDIGLLLFVKVVLIILHGDIHVLS